MSSLRSGIYITFADANDDGGDGVDGKDAGLVSGVERGQIKKGGFRLP